MKNVLFSPICATVLFALTSGCTVQTVHPFSEAGSVTHDAGLVGEWRIWNSEFGKWDAKIQVSEDLFGYYHVVDCNTEKPIRLAGQLIEVGEERYIELVSDGTENQDNQPLTTSTNSYLFARIERNHDQLTVWYPKFRALKDAVTNDSLKGIISDQRVVLTSPAKEICDYLRANQDQAFGEPLKYERRVTNNAK